MKRIVPYPLMTLSLVLMWLLLNQSWSLGHILLGAVIAVAAGRGMAMLQPQPVRIRFTLAIPRLLTAVLADIFRSNFAVGRIILFGNARDTHSGFLELPLDMKNRYGLAVLAVIVTATPGTLWMQYDPRRNILLLHILDLVDEQHWIQLIKNRYERQLMDIFE